MRLYKYVTGDRVDVLENANIRFTQPVAFNDPFEMAPVIRGVGTAEELGEGEDIVKTIREQYEALDDEQQAQIDFEQFFKAMVEQINESLEVQGALEEVHNTLLPRFYAETGVLSLTEEPGNLLMWAHYAGEHRGFVIEFDSEHDFFDQRSDADDQFNHLDKVRYSTQRPVTTLSNFLGPHTLLTKSDDWEYEQEWRMIVYFPKLAHEVIEAEGHDVYLVSIPPTAISGVILGCRMPEEKRRELVELVMQDRRYAHVELRQADRDETQFAVGYQDLAQHYYERGKGLMKRGIRWRDNEDDLELQKRGVELVRSSLPEFGRAIELAPNEPLHWTTRAVALQLLNKREESIEDYSRAIELCPGSPDCYMVRGTMRFELGQLGLAKADFERARQLGEEGMEPYIEAVEQAIEEHGGD